MAYRTDRLLKLADYLETIPRKRFDMKFVIKLTKVEVQMIQHALGIASEDGSIYGGAVSNRQDAAVNARLDTIHQKLRDALRSKK